MPPQASPDASDKDWISISSAAALCRVSRNTMRAWIEKGLVESRDGARGWPVVSRPFIEAWLRREAMIPAPPEQDA